MWANFQHGRTNTILGPDWQRLHGPEDLWQRFGGAVVNVPPGSFVQANFGAMDAALVAIAGSVLPHAAIADLHAGVGTIGKRHHGWVSQLIALCQVGSQISFCHIGTGVAWSTAFWHHFEDVRARSFLAIVPVAMAAGSIKWKHRWTFEWSNLPLSLRIGSFPLLTGAGGWCRPFGLGRPDVHKESFHETK